MMDQGNPNSNAQPQYPNNNTGYGQPNYMGGAPSNNMSSQQPGSQYYQTPYGQYPTGQNYMAGYDNQNNTEGGYVGMNQADSNDIGSDR